MKEHNTWQSMTLHWQLGVTLIGALLSMGLWGIGTAQVVYYYDVSLLLCGCCDVNSIRNFARHSTSPRTKGFLKSWWLSRGYLPQRIWPHTITWRTLIRWDSFYWLKLNIYLRTLTSGQSIHQPRNSIWIPDRNKSPPHIWLNWSSSLSDFFCDTCNHLWVGALFRLLNDTNIL